jgi:hypothetical protein
MIKNKNCLLKYLLVGKWKIGNRRRVYHETECGKGTCYQREWDSAG